MLNHYDFIITLRWWIPFSNHRHGFGKRILKNVNIIIYIYKTILHCLICDNDPLTQIPREKCQIYVCYINHIVVTTKQKQANVDVLFYPSAIHISTFSWQPQCVKFLRWLMFELKMVVNKKIYITMYIEIIHSISYIVMSFNKFYGLSDSTQTTNQISSLEEW